MSEAVILAENLGPFFDPLSAASWIEVWRDQYKKAAGGQ
jgi:hypothetical protein